MKQGILACPLFPPNYRDWLDLIYESIHNPEHYHVNLNHEGIKKVVELIEFDNLTGEQLHRMKVDAQRKVVRKIDEDIARKEGREILENIAKRKGINEGIDIGLKIGEKQGKKDGIKEGKIETAINMLKMGIEIETIIKATGLERKEIEALQKWKLLYNQGRKWRQNWRFSYPLFCNLVQPPGKKFKKSGSNSENYC